ncbi:hypothetical protein GCM10023313_17810 [Mucilaginibacter defluvii]|uniref:Uncharacterized protein n=1 Tax=Mucilaginibacter defluvii TaxID=1196019 RepID=A0ABP9FRW8_9SPHI
MLANAINAHGYGWNVIAQSLELSSGDFITCSASLAFYSAECIFVDTNIRGDNMLWKSSVQLRITRNKIRKTLICS